MCDCLFECVCLFIAFLLFINISFWLLLFCLSYLTSMTGMCPSGCLPLWNSFLSYTACCSCWWWNKYITPVLWRLNPGYFFQGTSYWQLNHSTTVLPQCHRRRGTTLRYLPRKVFVKKLGHFSEYFSEEKTVYWQGPKFTDDLRTILRQNADLWQSCDNWRIHTTLTTIERPILRQNITITF